MRLGTNEFFPQLFPKWHFLGKKRAFLTQKKQKNEWF